MSRSDHHHRQVMAQLHQEQQNSVILVTGECVDQVQAE